MSRLKYFQHHRTGLWAISTFHRVKYQTEIHLFTVCANQISVSANRTKFLRKMKHFESNFLIDYDCNFQVDFSALVVMAHQISKLIRARLLCALFLHHKLSLSLSRSLYLSVSMEFRSNHLCLIIMHKLTVQNYSQKRRWKF